jgi:hypothetical protein
MLSTRRLVHLSLAAAALTLLLAAVAVAAVRNGGGSISTAPALPLDATTPSGWNLDQRLDNGYYGEFFRLNMNAGDKVVLDIANTQSSCTSSAPTFWVYAPSITDFTLAQSNNVFQDGTNASKYETSWAAPSTGNWTVFFNGCPQTAYTFLARVQQFTKTQATVPSLVQHAKAFKVTGTVDGSGGAPVGGKVALAVKGPGLKKPLSLIASIASGGRFVAQLRLANVGTFTLRITYYGDSHHRPSSASAKIHVA